MGLLLSCVLIGTFTMLNNSFIGEGKVRAIDKQFEEDFEQRIIELVHFIDNRLKESDINVRMQGIQISDENFSNLLIYIETLTSGQDSGIVKRKVNEIVQLAKEKSLLKENEAFEIIIREQDKKE